MRADWPDAFRVAALCCVLIPPLAAADMDAADAALAAEDYELAVRELEPLAESGAPIAQYNLAVLHRKGLGTKKNQKAAAAWFRKSAEQGNGQAAFAMGMIYATGKGTKLDPVEAYAWFRIASRSGHEQAKSNLHRITGSMDLDQVMQSRKLFDQRWAEISNQHPDPVPVSQ